MRRSLIRIEDVADLGNLAWATWRAARGKRDRIEVRRFLASGFEGLARLREEILSGDFHLGARRRFVVRDPKRRVIQAPTFRERVLHHALMRHLGPVLDRALVDDTYACRAGRGPHRAVLRAQQHLRRSERWVQVDMRRYFASIDHAVLLTQLCRLVKGPAVLGLCRRIVEAYPESPGKGLPIGALTSQHFANLYLGALDRFLLESLRVRGMVRYMDDVVWWTETTSEARETLVRVRAFVGERLCLDLREPSRVSRSAHGLTLCGYRIGRARIRLTVRRKRRYARIRRKWEALWLAGRIGDRALQAGYAAALGITSLAEAGGFRRAELARRPAPEV